MTRTRPVAILAFTCIIVNVLLHQAHSEPQRRQSEDRQGKAERCNPDVCRLPDCFCGGKSIPGGFKPEQIPQFVLLTFDDAINGINKEFFSKLFNERYNPNGCPIKVYIILQKIIFIGFHIKHLTTCTDTFKYHLYIILGNFLPLA